MAQNEKNSFKNKLSALWTDKRNYKKRLLPAGAAMLAFCFTFIFFGPFEMIAFGGNAMSYDWHDIWWFMALFALGAFVAGTLLISLLRGKIYNYIVNFIFTITLCGYFQAALMNGSLGALTGDAIDWTSQADPMLYNLLIWALIFLVSYFILYLSRKFWKKIVVFTCVLLTFMQLVSTATIAATSDNTQKDIGNYGFSTQNMYSYSKADNIFIFVLDRLDYDYIEAILRVDPTFFDQLEGFTGYTNAISAYARTQPALNHMLTGSETAYDCAAEDFYQNSWTEEGKHILGELKNHNYTVELYTNPSYLFSDPVFAGTYTNNLTPTERLDPIKATKKLLQLSVYRYSPIALKPFFWADTSYYNSDVFIPGIPTYQYDDAGYAPGFRTATAQQSTSSFKLYHFFGAHSPYTMNADGSASTEPTSSLAQTTGSFRNLMAAFEQMKELGIYENATIIITADHGSAVSDTKPLQKATRIGLFYKPSGSADTPLVWSAAPVCTDNIPATLAQAVGVADITPYGTPLDQIGEDSDVVRYYYKSISSRGSYGESAYYKYEVVGNAADFNNWRIIDIVENLPEGNGFY